jgi:hypothetical protein
MTEFFSNYAGLRDEELLQIASDRISLTPEAAAALDAEMVRRTLTSADLTQHEKSVRQQTRREARRGRRKLFGRSRSRESLGDGLFTFLWAVLVFSLIWIGYVALPGRYHFSPDWEQTSVQVMIATILIAAASRFWWSRITFWISLTISSTIDAILLHMWIVRFGPPEGRRSLRLPFLLGVVLFGIVYGTGLYLRQKFSGEAEQ